MALVADSGPLLASLDAGDAHHDACTTLFAGSRELVILPAPILVEVEHLLRRARGAAGFAALLDDVRDNIYRVEDLVQADYDRVQELLRTYADLNVGFVDAAVLAIVERLGETKLATLDHRHFSVMRPRHTDSLELLPA